VAATFGLDPVTVLDETDELKWDLRVAAHNVIVKDRAAKKPGTGVTP
jgi:hypothetical protein